MNKNRLLIITLGILSIGLKSTQSHSYVPSRTDTSQKPIRWINTNCLYVTPNSKGSADIDDDSDFSAIEKSVKNWMDVTQHCSYLKLLLNDPSSTAVPGFNDSGNNENVIYWHETKCNGEQKQGELCWPEYFGSDAAAITTVSFIDKPDSELDGQIVDADIELNGAFDNLFIFSGHGESGRTDVENTVTHELGHLMGLDHPCDDDTRNPTPTDHQGNIIPNCFPEGQLPTWIKELTMYNFTEKGETKKRSLEQNDILGICATYPIDEDPQSCNHPTVVNGGCSYINAGGIDSFGFTTFLTILAACFFARTLKQNRRRKTT